MSRKCGACTAAVPDGMTLCADDAEALTDALHRIPSVVDDLLTTYARQDNMRPPGRAVGKSTETPLPWNDRIPARLDALTEVLTRWARPVARYRGLSVLPAVPFTRDPKDPARIPQAVSAVLLAARILGDHPDALRHIHDAGDAFTEITDAVRSATRATDRPMDRRFLGTCSELTEDGPCQVDLYAHPRRDTVQCPGCGVEHDVEYRRAVLLKAVHDEVVTYPEAERALGWLVGEMVRASTLRSWVSERRIVPEGYRHAGTFSPVKVGYHDQPLLRVGDIVEQYVRAAQDRQGATIKAA